MNFIANNIKNLRTNLNLTQAEVASKLYISTPALSKIERGITDINVPRLMQLAQLFKVPVAAIINDSTSIHTSKASILEMNIKLAKLDTEILRLKEKLLYLYEQRHEQQKKK